MELSSITLIELPTLPGTSREEGARKQAVKLPIKTMICF